MEAAARRIQKTFAHLQPVQTQECHNPVPVSNSTVAANESIEKSQADHPFKWNGWGYEDTHFALNEKGQIYLTGNHYQLCGIAFPKLRPWAEAMLGIDLSIDLQKEGSIAQEEMRVPPPIRHEAFLQAIQGNFLAISFEDKDRWHHAHGHTCEDVFRARYSTYERFPDVVVWPSSHEQVEALVAAAHQHNVVVIPYGGGTSVAEGLSCPHHEDRMIVSLDMRKMNKILWIDRDSLTACIETGIIGKDLDARLAKLGLCMGHEPDSSEWSTLGGWIATRASGMKKNVYGNIEDILISARLVTPVGVIEKPCLGPRQSVGPDVNEMILGSEGTLGVITTATLKLRPLPEVQSYGSIVFPNFETGVQFMREIAKQRAAPASIRLMDNTQFQLGQVLKPEEHSWTSEWIDAAKKWYVTQYMGYNVDTMVAATLLFEGGHEEMKVLQKKVYAIASKFNGIPGGEENGRRGYFLTYMIAYIRDFAFSYYFMAESFETSVPWSKCLNLCESVKDRIRTSCVSRGVQGKIFATCRVTQTYDAGACIYFYFGFRFKDLQDPLKVYVDVENDARDEILKCGGSLSHHHGVGKLRKKWIAEAISPMGVRMLKGLKTSADPKNIFANGNLF